MRTKKIIAFLLAFVMILALCGCGKAEAEAYEAPTEEVVLVEATAAVTATPAVGLDFDKAFAAHDPEQIVFYVDGTGVTWRELFYQVVYFSSIIAAQEGNAITSWDDPCTLFTDNQGNVYTYGEVVLRNSIDILMQYHIVENRLNEAGVVLDKESLDAVEAVRRQVIDTSFDGDEAAFLEYLESVYCTEELWNWFNQVDAAYNQGFNMFYGEMGSEYPDADVMEYANGDENGLWTEYVQLKMICLLDEEEPAATEEIASQEASVEPAAEDEDLANTILAELSAAEDKDAKYAELFALYNEDEGLEYFPDGWCVYQGDTNEAIYQAALDMDDYECRIVSLDGAEVVVMKVPLDPDGGVLYDVSTGMHYTVRYYAAMQDYAIMINGEDGWIAQGAANAGWAEGFEDFTLNSVF